MKSRLEFIDIARGIAIISIILGHMGSWQINRIVFTYHVPLFFFVSGYFIDTRRNAKEFVIHKIKTLLIPYTVTCIVIIAINMFFNYYIQGAEKAIEAIKYWSYASVYGAGDSYQEPFQIAAIGAIWFLWATLWGSLFLRISLRLSQVMRICMISGLFLLGYFSRLWFWFPFSFQAGCCATLFMYFGYLFKYEEPVLKELSKEIKCVAMLFALAIWIEFMKNFQSFWLVHCDIGRGVIDIFGCICGVSIIFIISWYIEKYIGFLAKPLQYIGKFSILALCIHIIEMDVFPWGNLTAAILARGIPATATFYLTIAAKLVLILGGTALLSKCKTICKIYGIK